MLYLRTGANGSGKTLLTLKEVRDKSVEENRPVAHNGRFRLKADFGWKQIDAKDWQDEPDGTIFLIDEAHNDFPICDPKALPDHMKMLAEHRVRGFDFYLITQHPLNINAFVRRLIGAPGWHQHLKRASGAPLVSTLTWSEVNTACEKPGAGASGQVKMVAYPKEVYEWYESTTLDTAKLKIPAKVWMLGAMFIIVPAAVYFAVTSFSNQAKQRQENIQKLSGRPVADAGGSVGPGQVQQMQGAASLSPQAYANTYQPRLGGLAYTAVRYDALTQPTEVPVPAACVMGVMPNTKKRECRCYTQQATRMEVELPVCEQIAMNGLFQDFQTASQQNHAKQAQQDQPKNVEPPPPTAVVFNLPAPAPAAPPAAASQTPPVVPPSVSASSPR